MNDPLLEQMHRLLPELFRPAGKTPAPGGMCTPESGCPPAADHPGTDILEGLRKSVQLDSEEPDGGPGERG